MVTFENLTEENIYIAEEIVNSNRAYNKMENGHETRSTVEVKEDLINGKSEPFFIKADDTYIGLIDYMMCNEKDRYPWLGLLMIHEDYKGYGYGTSAYLLYEQQMKERGVEILRLAVLKENVPARKFWERLGFNYYMDKPFKHTVVECFEKRI
ncbi:GNAT family N-acetyltransferase [Peribacillus alkalitolerans]|uniref:GNAT family N-acetyltransferase n=1 Tax=Peribacillus alkalitolerans TaxID=1550385 RepID=UPI0013D48EFF|nr:GNAT family N-acetyltransferase [Peribacillus alkalitolerans]